MYNWERYPMVEDLTDIWDNVDAIRQSVEDICYCKTREISKTKRRKKFVLPETMTTS